MQLSYRQMIDDHEEIGRAADRLLRAATDPHVSAASIAGELTSLAGAIEEHIATESAVVSKVNADPLPEPWTLAWQDGWSAFERLRRDWTKFLYRWSRETIHQDRDGFADDAAAILGRLRERLQLETRAFYATALQVGALELR